MKRFLAAALGGVLIAVAGVTAAYLFRHGAVVTQARHFHESVPDTLALGGLSIAAVATVLLGAAGSAVRSRRRRRLGLGPVRPRAITW